MADGQFVNVVEENCKEEDFRSLKVQRNVDHSGEECGDIVASPDTRVYRRAASSDAITRAYTTVLCTAKQTTVD